ncbi:hypothetical protein J5069_02985 [Candidatus Symbiopectobacterium sp. NZEC127]|uniref:hypothetical protein n=1 Tax=Candidatus Symbiopectobacterium sp. NZEC127 TaxID=2820472 RepID=UPI0022265684|nr:hypothetical protein [Candidatus Symbiopectobacterium sp. NZEC127]MCW2484856.1 hypothetical protein [Candidatus Symbiopectobacterium sp. NZEC127]
MKISIFDNGMDSLKKGFMHLENFENLHFRNNNGKEKFFLLKDAIMNTHHGVEILLKQILINENELFAFSNIDKDLKFAIKEKREKNLKSIFEASCMPHTVTFREAIDRVKSLCGFSIQNSLESKLIKLESYRNQITHASIISDENDVLSTFEHLADHLDVFFLKALGNSYISLGRHDEFKKTCLASKDDSSIISFKKKSTLYLIEELEKISITLSPNGFKTIKDITLLKAIFSKLNNSNFSFGMDIYNGFNSGSVGNFHLSDSREMKIFALDNNSEYHLKIRELLIFTPSTDLTMSPLFVIYTDKYHDFSNTKSTSLIRTNEKIDCYEGMIIKDNGQEKCTWDKDEISKIHSYDDDKYFEIHKKNIYAFSGRGVFCFINIQKLQFRGAEFLLQESCDSLREIEILLRTQIK